MGKRLYDFICGCGDGPEGAIEVLRDFLNVFEPDDNHEAGYLSLDKQGEFGRKHGRGVYHLIFGLMEGLGYCGHYGSVSCSAYLTDKGGDLKRRVASGAEYEAMLAEHG